MNDLFHRLCPHILTLGKDVLPDFCSGRSATRKMSQVLSLNRKTPGFSRHSTFIPSMLGRMSAGLRMGFSAKHFAMSGISFLSAQSRPRTTLPHAQAGRIFRQRLAVGEKEFVLKYPVRVVAELV